MIATLRRRLTANWAALRAEPERGAETVDILMWVAVMVVIVGGLGALFSADITAFYHSIVFSIGM
jgi:hypothetical protein